MIHHPAAVFGMNEKEIMTPPKKPVLVTHWYSSLRLLEAMLRRVRPYVNSCEWWVLYGRYPKLGTKEGVSDTRGAQNLCKELGLDWYDVGEEMPIMSAVQKWALDVGATWPMDKIVCMIAQDACPENQCFLDEMYLHMHGKNMATLVSPYTGFPGVTMVTLRECYAPRMEMPKAAMIPKKSGMDIGGPSSRGGVYPDALYDPEWLEWSSGDKAKTFREWLEAREPAKA